MGNSSIAKKSLLFRWASRSALRVSMLAAWIVILAEDLDGSAASAWTVHSNSLKAPRTFVTMAWRAVKQSVLRLASRVYATVSWVRSRGLELITGTLEPVGGVGLS